MTVLPDPAERLVAVPLTTSPPVILPLRTEVAATPELVPAASVTLPPLESTLPFSVRLPITVEILTSPVALMAPRFKALLLATATVVALVTLS